MARNVFTALWHSLKLPTTVYNSFKIRSYITHTQRSVVQIHPRKQIRLLILKCLGREERGFVTREVHASRHNCRLPYAGLFKRTLPGLTANRLIDGASALKAPIHLFRDWQRTSTQTSVTAWARESKWMDGSALHRRSQNKSARKELQKHTSPRALRARYEDPRFSLDSTYHGCPEAVPV